MSKWQKNESGSSLKIMNLFIIDYLFLMSMLDMRNNWSICRSLVDFIVQDSLETFV